MFGAPSAPLERTWKKPIRAVNLASSIARAEGSRFAHA
jgi:hypothetical protein